MKPKPRRKLVLMRIGENRSFEKDMQYIQNSLNKNIRKGNYRELLSPTVLSENSTNKLIATFPIKNHFANSNHFPSYDIIFYDEYSEYSLAI